MLRAALACLAFLLLAMQQETLLHPLQHDAARFAEHRQVAFHNAGADGPCAWCPLYAGGSHAVAVSLAGLDLAAKNEDVAPTARPQRFAAAPVYYASRAPPPART